MVDRQHQRQEQQGPPRHRAHLVAHPARRSPHSRYDLRRLRGQRLGEPTSADPAGRRAARLRLLGGGGPQDGPAGAVGQLRALRGLRPGGGRERPPPGVPAQQGRWHGAIRGGGRALVARHLGGGWQAQGGQRPQPPVRGAGHAARRPLRRLAREGAAGVVARPRPPLLHLAGRGGGLARCAGAGRRGTSDVPDRLAGGPGLRRPVRLHRRGGRGGWPAPLHAPDQPGALGLPGGGRLLVGRRQGVRGQRPDEGAAVHWPSGPWRPSAGRGGPVAIVEQWLQGVGDSARHPLRRLVRALRAATLDPPGRSRRGEGLGGARGVRCLPGPRALVSRTATY
mmetsp:Transcript_38753/g.87985  ORF Transcript_38753/g.87985 Transcript_38753/m.87985 type:complete len:338 (+) Transcript_38753:1001-2014(+)